ncbi:hypothetical protein B8V81_5053 [Paenibacillus pasadenensis]|uniref:Uncharacterized protein n=1 Tax=Paenibacillus pasadenensis TaxID=217090 RepID=A0A2N5MZJ8_9BACL|nr:hypothetical protein B8V81_5053 [Paenibacillus pasadenensis]
MILKLHFGQLGRSVKGSNLVKTFRIGKLCVLQDFSNVPESDIRRNKEVLRLF